MSSNAPEEAAESGQENPPTADAEPLLEVSGLKKYFKQSGGFLDDILGDTAYVRAVDDVDLTIRDGETLAVVGESGCGKSTLGETILKLHEPTDGTIRFDGDDITDLSKREVRPYRRRMQVIFQDPLASLNPRQTVGGILRAPMEVHDIGDDKADRTERAESILEEVGLKASHLDRYPHQFSGGQQQRIGLARALTVNPDLVIADEPVSALDVSVQSQVLNLFDDLKEEYGLSMMFVAHDLSVVRHIADRVAVMYLGKIVETAPVEELFEDPQHPYTKALLSAVPRITPSAREGRLVLRGSVPSPIDPPDGCRFHTRCPAIIPPDGWPADQEMFRRVFTFRTRVEEERLEPEAVRTRLKAEGSDTSDEAVVDQILTTELPVPVTELPDELQGTVREAARRVAEGDDETAAELLIDVLPSPCVDEVPDHVGDSERMAACHRVDPEKPYGEIL